MSGVSNGGRVSSSVAAGGQVGTGQSSSAEQAPAETSNRGKSAAPSEPFTWLKTWPYDRSCSACGKELRVEDVGEHRTLYENGKEVRRFLWCKEHRGQFEWEPQEC